MASPFFPLFFHPASLLQPPPLLFSLFLVPHLRREDAKTFIMKAFSRRSAATKVTVNPAWGITAGVLLLPSSVLSGRHGASSIEGPLVVHTGWFVWRLLAFSPRFFLGGSWAIRSPRPGRRRRWRVHQVWAMTNCWDETLQWALLAGVKKGSTGLSLTATELTVKLKK